MPQSRSMRLPGHFHRAQDLIGFTRARVGLFFPKARRSASDTGRPKMHKPHPRSLAEGQLHAPCSGQLDLPPTATQRSFPWPHCLICTQWFTREPQFRHLLPCQTPHISQEVQMPLSHALLPSGAPDERARFCQHSCKLQRICIRALFSNDPNNCNFSTVRGYGSTWSSTAL